MEVELPLAGRAAENRVLAAAATGVKAGRGSAVLLLGEPGIGKTRLLASVRTISVANDIAVFSGRAVESSGAYAPLVEAFARSAAGLCRGSAVDECACSAGAGPAGLG